MRFTLAGGLGRHAVVLLALVIAAPLLNGCSQLGIATADDLTAVESRMDSSNRTTGTRLDELEKSSNEMQQTLLQITTSLDTLNVRFARAKEWLETLNIDSISADTEAASKAALAAEERSKAFLNFYFEWIKTQHAELEKQIKLLDESLKDDGTGSPPPSPTDKSSDSGGGDDSSGDGGGG